MSEVAEKKSWTPQQLAEHIKSVCGEQIAAALGPLQRTVSENAGWITQQTQRGMTEVGAQRTLEQKGAVIGGIIAAVAGQKINGGTALDFAKSIKNNEDVVKALEVSTMTGGGALVPEEVSSDFIDLLTPRAVLRSFGPMVLPMTNGTVTVSKLTTSASAYYIGENKDAVKSQQGFGMKKLTARKLAALVPISNDLIRRGGSRVNTIVRNDTLRAVSLKEDLTFMRSLGTEYAPKGLRYLAHADNVFAAQGSPTLEKVTEDLGSMILKLEEADVAMTNPGWVFAPRTKLYLMTVRDTNGNFAFRAEMLTGKLWGWPFRTTTQVPTNLGSGSDSEIYLADFDDVVIGQTMSLDVAVSTEASYKDENGDLVSAFSLDQTVMRVITEHDLGLRHDESVSVLTGVTWTPTN